MDIINNSVINPQIPASSGTFEQRERGEILIVTNDQFISAVNRLAQWKRQMGFDVTIESRSSWPTDDVKTFLSSRASNPPDYIILFGDHPFVESKCLYITINRVYLHQDITTQITVISLVSQVMLNFHNQQQPVFL
jgi:hypothetical protein